MGAHLAANRFFLTLFTGLYYGITIAIVSFGTAMTTLTLNIHHMGARGQEPPKIVKKICFGLLAKLMCLNFDAANPYETHQVSCKFFFIYRFILRHHNSNSIIWYSYDGANSKHSSHGR